MKILLTERQYKIPLEKNSQRIRYLEKLVAQLNNELITDSLTPVDRSRFYNSLLTALKVCHDVSVDGKLEDIEKRLTALEKQLKEKGKE